jgi:hypothetical protein
MRASPGSRRLLSNIGDAAPGGTAAMKTYAEWLVGYRAAYDAEKRLKSLIVCGPRPRSVAKRFVLIPPPAI